MKLKYYLRGLGIGVIVTTLILMICFSFQKEEISDEEIRQRAAALGMVMPESEASEKQEEKAAASEESGTEKKTPDTETNTKKKKKSSESSQKQEDAVASTQQSNESEQAAQEKKDSQQAEQTPDAQPQQAETYRLRVERGQVCRNICDTLAENGIIGDSELFRQYLSQIGYASQISIGTYEIPYGLTMEEVAAVLQAGPIEKRQ